MELKWLEDLMSLAETGSFSQSADQRFITQSAFSRRIKALEEWLGVRLIDRSTYPTQLTPAGKQFHETARKVIASIYDMRQQAQQVDKGNRWVEFAAPSTIAARFFPGWLETIEQDVPPIRARIFASNLHDCVQSFVSDSVDFLFVYSHPASPLSLDAARFESILVGRDRLVPVCGVGGGRAVLSLRDDNVTTFPLLSYGAHSPLNRIVQDRVGRNSGERVFEPVYENSLADALKGMAIAGHGIAWIPLMSAAADLEAGRLALAGGDIWEISLDIRLYRSREADKSPLDRIWSAARSRAF